MRATALGAVAACVLGLAGLGTGGARGGQTACGSLSLGPGSVHHSTGQGARCMLLAYQSHCHPARYQVAVFGVDTVATRSFSVNARTGRCGIDVTTSFRVVPQPPRVTGLGRCRALRRTGSDVVAVGCRGGGLPATISLTGIS
jgi:hypothetical protein